MVTRIVELFNSSTGHFLSVISDDNVLVLLKKVMVAPGYYSNIFPFVFLFKVLYSSWDIKF